MFFTVFCTELLVYWMSLTENKLLWSRADHSWPAQAACQQEVHQLQLFGESLG
jgi:hypothetical protein